MVIFHSYVSYKTIFAGYIHDIALNFVGRMPSTRHSQDIMEGLANSADNLAAWQ